ncbi:hypothetical protein GGR53DRAFT_73211 [Hypoxylon sp. FL1150]|nr:hypothetical protein GGR53DRAFT_73211 [Hypoxylon sp. FL1150]
MIDRYENERPVMHGCGHIIHMTTFLVTSALLTAAAQKWRSTLVIIFQPDEKEAGRYPSND